MTFRSPVDAIVERAIAKGELDNLPGRGKPLNLDDDAGVPEDMRLSYRVMKNAGIVPPEVEAMKRITALRAQLANESDPAERHRLAKEISCQNSVLRLKLERMAQR